MDKKWFENELRSILEYWKNTAFDKEKGLFYPRIDNDNTIFKEGGRGLTITARGIWAFASGYEYFKDESYLEIAKQLFESIEKFKDDIFYCWVLSDDNTPYFKNYDFYYYSFTIYGCAKLYQITKEQKYLDKAMKFFEFFEKYARNEKGYYYCQMSKDFKHLKRFFKKENCYAFMDMNADIHIMEAYAMLYSVNKDEKVKEAFLNSVNLVINKVYNKKTKHLSMLFDENMNPVIDTISCGHDIETSWLLTRCTALIDDRDLIEKINKISVDLAYSAINDGYDKNFGGLLETKEDDKKLWWDQAEAVVGSYNAYLLTKDEFFREKSEEFLEYIKEHFIAPDGEWYLRISADGKEILTSSKVALMKCPYHNSRMCLEMIKMLDR